MTDDLNNSNLPMRKLIITVLVLSILFGGLTGGIMSFVAGTFFSLKLPAFLTAPVQNKTKTITVEEDSATIEAVKTVSPSVVSIVVTKDLSQYYNLTGPEGFPFDEFFGFPFRLETPQAPQGKQEVGGGTGFIISEDGMILTNKHVVSDTEAEYSVILNDGTKYDAQVLGRDLVNDIAIVKIEVKDKTLTPVKLGDSDKIEIGQTVIAIGNALAEYRNTVTKGVISGIDRKITAGDGSGQSESIDEAIQTDAAINPGNSGGPLLNLSGEVIGVNTAISNQGQLIGFAIPINSAKQVIESVKKNGKIVRAFLGVRYVLINKQIAEANKLPFDYGALIIRGSQPAELAVMPGSPADKAGLTENDIILEIAGQQINEENTLAKIISQYQPGDEIELKVYSQGEEKMVEAQLTEYQE